MKEVTLTVFLLLFVASAFANSNLQLKIVGGRNAKKGEFPYQVSLQLQFLKKSSIPTPHQCGGSIISPNWVVSAAHCIISSEKYQIVAGINNLSDKHGQVIKVKKIIIHPDYIGQAMPDDIALLQLEKPLKFNNLVQTIALPKAGAIPTGNFTVSGWGSTSTTFPQTNKYSNELKTTVLPLVNIDACKLFFDILPFIGNQTQNINWKHKINNKTNICTGPLKPPYIGFPGFCTGDSGGPLVQNGVLIGIVSWMAVPCTLGANVFTNVASFIPFIRENVKDLPK